MLQDDVRPGSPEAAQVKEALIAEGLWSQYLEVGIGPDPEIFTKAAGALRGRHRRRHRRTRRLRMEQPRARGGARRRQRRPGARRHPRQRRPLRDIEGRSALLLPRAKDNNASCAIGPFLRLLDADFGLDDVRTLDIELRIDGADGYVLRGTSSMREISRDVLDLVAAVHGPHHQHPDGFALFTGTLFAPTEDRHAPGAGFTHDADDVVHITSPRLGALINTVTTSEHAAPWEFGLRALMTNLVGRGLL